MSAQAPTHRAPDSGEELRRQGKRLANALRDFNRAYARFHDDLQDLGIELIITDDHGPKGEGEDR